MEETAGLTEGAIYDALGYVIDPEVGLDVVTMGLIYGVSIEEGVVRIRYTLTTPGCPMETVITQGIVAMASSVEGVKDVRADLVFEPAWNPGMIQEGAL